MVCRPLHPVEQRRQLCDHVRCRIGARRETDRSDQRSGRSDAGRRHSDARRRSQLRGGRVGRPTRRSARAVTDTLRFSVRPTTGTPPLGRGYLLNAFNARTIRATRPSTENKDDTDLTAPVRLQPVARSARVVDDSVPLPDRERLRDPRPRDCPSLKSSIQRAPLCSRNVRSITIRTSSPSIAPVRGRRYEPHGAWARRSTSHGRRYGYESGLNHAIGGRLQALPGTPLALRRRLKLTLRAESPRAPARC